MHTTNLNEKINKMSMFDNLRIPEGVLDLWNSLQPDFYDLDPRERDNVIMMVILALGYTNQTLQAQKVLD